MNGMFSVLDNVESLDLRSFDTRNVTDMANMFAAKYPISNGIFKPSSTLKKIDLSTFNTEKVTNMSTMFHGLTSLEHLDISSFNTSNVTNMQGMFGYDVNLKSINTGTFDVSQVTTMDAMFLQDSALEKLDVANWDVSKVTSMMLAFVNNRSLKTLDVANWNTDNLENAAFTFAFTNATIDTSRWVLPKINLSSGMFQGAQSKLIDLSNMAMNTSTNTSVINILYGSFPIESGIKLGPKTVIGNTGDSSGMSTKIIFNSDGSPTRYLYGTAAGKVGLQAVGTGTINNPQGPVYTFSELNTLYSSGSGPVETYVLTKHAIVPGLIETTFTADDNSITADTNLLADGKSIKGKNLNLVTTLDFNNSLPTPPSTLNNGEYVLDTSLHGLIMPLFNGDTPFEPFNFNTDFLGIGHTADDLNYNGHKGIEGINEIIRVANQNFMTTLQNALTGTDHDLTDFMANLDLQFTFHYIHQKAAPITVKYVDEQGNKIATGTVTYPNGMFINQSYGTELKTISGYHFLKLSDNSKPATGTLDAVGGIVTYVYGKNEVLGENITVNVIDSASGKVLKTTIFMGNVDSNIKLGATKYVPNLYHLSTSDELDGKSQFIDGNYTWSTTSQNLNIYVSSNKETSTETKAVTRTIQFVSDDDELTFGDITETAKLSREVTKDLVSGAIVSTTGWTPSGSGMWRAITIPTVTGYHTNITQLPDQKITGDTPDIVVQVTYVKDLA